jgi:hypothetical protein
MKHLSRMQKVIVATWCAVLAINLIILIWGDRVGLAVANARGGCYPWSAREVPYRDGMTLCPGQSTTFPIPIVIKKGDSI